MPTNRELSSEKLTYKTTDGEGWEDYDDAVDRQMEIDLKWEEEIVSYYIDMPRGQMIKLRELAEERNTTTNKLINATLKNQLGI